MNTKILEYIIAIEEEGSISRAAERFYLSQPMLSRHLKNIEEELGCEIFRRDKKGMVPTRAGVIYLTNARKILKLQETLEHKLDVLRIEQNMVSISIYVDTHIYTYFFQNVFPVFQNLHPDINLKYVRTSYQEIFRALESGEADVAICYSLDDDPNISRYSRTELYREPYRLYFTTAYDGPLDMDSLKAALSKDLIMTKLPKTTTLRLIQNQWLERAGLNVPEGLETSGILNSINYVAGHSGNRICAFLPESMSYNLSDHRSVPCVPPCSPSFSIFMKPENEASEAMIPLVNILKEYFTAEKVHDFFSNRYYSMYPDEQKK